MLGAELEAMKRDERLLRQAKHDLLEHLRSSKLTAWGVLEMSRDRRNPAATHEAIPLTVFMSDLVAVTERNTVSADLEHPTAQFDRRSGPDYREVRFQTAEVLALWPVIRGPQGSHPELAAGKIVSDRTGARGRPTSSHLIKAEFQRRIEMGQICESIKKEAVVLAEWLKLCHPGLAPMTPKSIENAIRDEYRERKLKKATK